MALLSKIRGAAFLVMLLTAALTPGAPLSADEDDCSGYGHCMWCDSGSICWVESSPPGCSGYQGCQQIGFCYPDGLKCSCDPCGG
jgi:hypothetical protein